MGIDPAAIGGEGGEEGNEQRYDQSIGICALRIDVFLLVYCPDIVSSQPWAEDINLFLSTMVVVVGIAVVR